MAESPLSPPKPYVGRFAPSPSGPLHFGSLVCALASFLDARANQGKWLLRIEDIDPPREQPGADDAIKRTLDAHGLFWDGEVRYQSKRSEAYLEALDQLQSQGLLYRCNCTRKRLTPLQGRYDGYCRTHPPRAKERCSLRLKTTDLPPEFSHINDQVEFSDLICGAQQEVIHKTSGDFVLHRKDGLFAYQLAVVVDDIDQGITDIIRGDDLLDTTARQIFLYRIFNKSPPCYGHIPVVKDANGNKLSKQNHAPEVSNSNALENLKGALQFLGINSNIKPNSPREILDFATHSWRSKWLQDR